ncbi:MAG: cytochrome c biogenesis protein CcdA [Actinomycetota bacterium]
MTDNVTLVAAFGAGLISFLSPCVLPIIPGYLSLVTGLEAGELESRDRAATIRVVTTTGLFVAGFGIVFVALGLGATQLGSTLLDNQRVLTQVSGVLLLSMALFLIGSLYLQAPWLYQEARFHPELSRYGPFAAPVAGVAFGFGWTPCIGPVLTSVLAVAATDGRASRGALLLAVYTLGLGLPFLISGLAFTRATAAIAAMRRHLRAVTWLSALSLAFFGALLTLDRLSWLTIQIQRLARTVGLEFLVELG